MIVTAEISEVRRTFVGRTGSLGLVTTMGALHAGHISLVERARLENDLVAATIFVNPTQFAPDEDLDKYPRTLSADLEKLEAAGVDLVFTPTSDSMYPDGFQTSVTVHEVTQPLEGASRPEHFGGVATVVTKLFNIVQPDRAYFGQKDAQQCVVIKRMVKDLNLPLEIVVCPIVREANGLAMSSRNKYLSAEEYKAAAVLNRSLKHAEALINNGNRDADAIRQQMIDMISAEPLANIDYVSIADSTTLEEAKILASGQEILISLTVQFGTPRLLDNIILTVK